MRWKSGRGFPGPFYRKAPAGKGGQEKEKGWVWKKGRSRRAFLLQVLTLMGLFLFQVRGQGAGAGSALNHFTFGRLDIVLKEEGFVEDTLAVPGMSIPKAPKIENVGEVDAVVFMEVEIPRARLQTVSDFAAQEEGVEELFSFTPKEGWTLMNRTETDQAAIYLYAYNQTLSAGSSTPPLFEELITISYLEGSFGDGQQVHVMVRARAIQAQAAQGTREETYDLYLRDAND